MNPNVVNQKRKALASVDTGMKGLANQQNIYFQEDIIYGHQLTSQLNTQITEFYEESSKSSKITCLDILVTAFLVVAWSGFLLYCALDKIAVI